MPITPTYPGVYIEEQSSGVRTITGVSTSIALFIGWASKGATDRAIRIVNFSDFDREFGGLDTRSLLGYSVRQFFDNGGADAYVIRLTHTDSAPASAVINANLTVSASSPGKWANSLSIRITRRSDDATRFRIDVINTDDAVLESFSNLSMDENDARFPPNIINGRANLISVTATDAAAAPNNGGKALNDTDAGDDGTVLSPTGVTAAIFHAAVLANFGVGTVTDRIDIFNIVCVPGETDATTLALLQGFCRERRAFLVVDSVVDETVANMQASGTTDLTGNNAINAAIYYPWVHQSDPLQAGAIRAFPPCGFVAGIFARTDATRGVWKAPAGSDASINGAVGLEIAMSNAENGQLNSLGINCLRVLPVFGNVVWGSRTLHGHNDRGSEWKYIPVRRTALFIEESLYRGSQWIVFEPNDEPLWAQIRLNFGSFMHNLFRQGAFQGTTPKQAYLVKCDSETTTQNDINQGIVNIVVGFAPLKPAEFVIIKIQQLAGQVEA
ncbi:MAG: phage tail sheath family protein [Thiohalomonadales bacterium]